MDSEQLNDYVEDHTKELIDWVFDDIRKSLKAPLIVFQVSDELSAIGIRRIFPDDHRQQVTPLCREIYRNDKLALECENDLLQRIQSANIPGEYPCHCGLPSILWPIRVEGEHVGTVLCGQRLLQDSLPEAKKMFSDFLNKYKEIIPDREILKQKFAQTPVVSRMDFNQLYAELKGTANLMGRLYFDRQRIDGQRAHYEKVVRRISHELQNYTQAALGSTGELRHRLQTGDLDMSRAVGRDLKGTLVHMVTMARNVTWSPPPDIAFVAIDLLDIIRKCIRFYQWFAANRGVAIKFHADEGKTTIMGSSIHLEQVVANLLHNAIKFSKGEQVEIRMAFIPEKRIQVQFINKGIGIPEKQYKLIFDEPYRGSGAWQSDRLGMGLGLHIVKGIVEMHHGSVRVESKPYKDKIHRTVFTVDLPS